MKLTRRGFLAALAGAIFGRLLPWRKPSYPHISGAGQVGSTLSTAGWASHGPFLRKGDVLTIEGMNALNPRTGEPTARLLTFVVTADSGPTPELQIYPPIITSGPYRNASAPPAHGARIAGYNPAGSLFHPRQNITQQYKRSRLSFHPAAFYLEWPSL